MTSYNKTTEKIPNEFKKFFWDVEFEELSLKKNARFIAERILNYGDINEVRWLLSFTSKAFLRETVKNSRNLNAKTKNFWEVFLTKTNT